MTYEECVACLDGLGHELRGIKFDLDGIRRVLDALGNPERSYPTAIVAGTNGKGSTCAMLASILECAGYRTGLYTSPHLVRVNERICVSGREISDEAFATAFTEVWQAVEGRIERGAWLRRLSFFEILTASAFLHFARARVDFAVFEVGMGGRLDATNVTEPRVAIITNVDLDHEEFLGATHALIAREKAGVIKAGRPVVSACEHPEARDVIRERSKALGAELLELPDLGLPAPVRDGDGQFVFDLTLNGDVFRRLEPALSGRFQVRNAAAAVAAAWRLRREGFAISHDAMAEGLGAVRWPGRLQVIQRQPLILLDGAHNPAAAREVAEFVREQFPGRRVRLVYASMRDKSIEEVSGFLFPVAEEIYLTRVAVPRAASPEEILTRASARGARMIIDPDPADALQRACQASNPEDVVLVAGSLYLVGAIQQARLEGRLLLEPVPEHSSLSWPR